MDSRMHDQDILISKCPLRRSALERRIKHYSNSHQILLVGEGDFSFSLALASAFGYADNMVATSLDSREKITSSYESGQCNLHNLKQRGAKILHNVDVTTMHKLEIMRDRLFDRIVYNFPHAGFFGKEEDTKLIRKHRHLLKMFFQNGMTMLSQKGEIHVSHKEKHPYDKWKLVEQAQKCGLVLKNSVDFNKADYPGYTNRRGAGPNIGETFFLGECKTYMFIPREFMTTPTILPKLSSQGHPKSLKAAILELETERQNRKAAETAKANLEFSFNELKTVLDKALKERDAFRRNKDEALREKAKITKQLAEALRLKEDGAKQKDVTVLELEFERKARKDTESARANIETSLNHYKASVYYLEPKKINQLERQRDDALQQKEEACREKEKIAKQLDEAMRFKEEATNEKERILREPNYLANQEAKVSKQLLAEALRLKEDAVKQRDATILELEFERKARKDAESARANIGSSLNHYKASVYDWELEKKNQLGKQRDDALYKKEVAWMKKEKIVKQPLLLKEEATSERERTLSEPNDLANQMETISCWNIFASCFFRH